jgi:polygalacturonase
MSKNNLLSRVKRLAISASLVLASVGMAQTEITVVGQSQESIQAALDALGGRGTVFVPAGRYQIDGTLIIRNDEVTLQGVG